MDQAGKYNIDSEIAFIENLGKHCEEPKAARGELLIRYQLALHRRHFNFCGRRVALPLKTRNLLEAVVAHELAVME